MFKELEKALRFDGFYKELDDVEERIRRAGVKYNSLSRWRRDGNQKAPESNIGELQELARKCVEGVRELDDIIWVFRSWRDMLARNVFQIRNAFPSFMPGVVDKMRKIADSDEEGVCCPRARKLLAEFLGYDKLPDDFVCVELSTKDSMVVATFGLKGKPTRIGIWIPVAVDYANSIRIQDMNDDELGFAEVKVGDLEKLVPLIVLGVSVGIGNHDCRSSKFKTVEEVKSAIEKILDYDARNSIKEIDDVCEANDADDFSEWRMRRFANRRAAENSEDELVRQEDVS